MSFVSLGHVPLIDSFSFFGFASSISDLQVRLHRERSDRVHAYRASWLRGRSSTGESAPQRFVACRTLLDVKKATKHALFV